MSDYRGNFYSSDAYNPEYNSKKLGVFKSHVVTAAEVTATKVELAFPEMENFGAFLAIIYRPTGVGGAVAALSTLYTHEIVSVGGVIVVRITGNANYTLTKDDVITYMVTEAV